MIAVNFKEANKVFTGENCFDLPVYVGKTPEFDCVIISAWKPNKEEIEAINRGEPIYLSVVGTVQPPVLLWGESPFKPEKIEE